MKMRVLSVLLLFALAACGGGGGSGGGTPPVQSINPPVSNAGTGGSSSTGSAIPKQYTLTDLGSVLPGKPPSPGLVPFAVNDSGVVVGEASAPILSSLPSCTPKTCGPTLGWVFENGALRTLPALGTDTLTFADDINNAGVISGGSVGATIEEAVLWNPDLSIVNLGTGVATPGSSAEATAISNGGKIYGESFNATTTVPTIFDGKGGAFDPCGSGIQGYFRSANNVGVGVGDEILSAGGTAAMICPPFMAIETPPNPKTLDFGFGINNNGVVVGRLEVGPTNASFHPFVYQNGTTTDLGTPLFPGNSQAVGAAFAINNAGTIVGWTGAGGGVIAKPPIPPINPRAFIYANGKMVDLNTLLPASCAAWRLVTANHINDRGQIVGTAFVGGYPNGAEHGYLLTPH